MWHGRDYFGLRICHSAVAPLTCAEMFIGSAVVEFADVALVWRAWLIFIFIIFTLQKDTCRKIRMNMGQIEVSWHPSTSSCCMCWSVWTSRVITPFRIIIVCLVGLSFRPYGNPIVSPNASENVVIRLIHWESKSSKESALCPGLAILVCFKPSCFRSYSSNTVSIINSWPAKRQHAIKD